MVEFLQQAVTAADGPTFGTMVFQLLIAFGLGILVAAVHFLASGKSWNKADHSLMTTLVLLSILIALVTMIIGNSVARAFSLVGALAIVRFRTVVEDTRDTAFVIFAVIAGMAAGTGHALGPIVCAPLVLAGAWLFRPHVHGPAAGKLVVRLAAGRPVDGEIDAILKQHVPICRLIGMETARGGAALDVMYAIKTPPPDKVFALIAALNRVEGVQGVEVKDD